MHNTHLVSFSLKITYFQKLKEAYIKVIYSNKNLLIFIL